MAFLACITTVVSFVCNPLTDALESFLLGAARDAFSFLRDWVSGEINNRISAGRRAVEEVPVSSACIVGLEETLQEIRTHLSDDSVGVIGIHGMGGIGKTVLLQMINNEVFKSRAARGKFDLVIWVTVSQEVNISNIQKQICDRLGLPSSEGEHEQARLLFKALSTKRFLVLLDDVWVKLDLVKVGIPVPKGRANCKVAFTTRCLQVCIDMDADKNVEVKRLNETHSWRLFCSKLGNGMDVIATNPSIQTLAWQVVCKCGGLPLALNTVGKAMATKRTPNEWEHAVMALDRSPESLRGIKDQVLSCLKFSYDHLDNDKMRSALLYCAMYPEDEDISREELIWYWVGEGLLDGEVGDFDEGIDGAYNRGHVLISDLQDCCLLEAGILDPGLTVRMHDAVRDLALWLNREEYDKIDGFLVFDKKSLTQVLNPIQRRQHVRRMWMRDIDWRYSPCCIPDCPNTWTLLLHCSVFEHSLFQSLINCMRTLRVLDLSINQALEELPIEVGLLVELRYLNLSLTSIRSLPKELGNLAELRGSCC